MKISLVIPVYNEEKYLKSCLRTIINQKVKPYEVIIIDNNSQDNSLKIISNLYNKLPPLKIVQKKTRNNLCLK